MTQGIGDFATWAAALEEGATVGAGAVRPGYVKRVRASGGAVKVAERPREVLARRFDAELQTLLAELRERLSITSTSAPTVRIESLDASSWVASTAVSLVKRPSRQELVKKSEMKLWLELSLHDFKQTRPRRQVSLRWHPYVKHAVSANYSRWVIRFLEAADAALAPKAMIVVEVRAEDDEPALHFSRRDLRSKVPLVTLVLPKDLGSHIDPT